MAEQVRAQEAFLEQAREELEAKLESDISVRIDSVRSEVMKHVETRKRTGLTFASKGKKKQSTHARL